ncbi:hypothetical protein TWF481_007625 [Arthrobotrys musiformis]|uniref:Uncharacterized protein n=1 Tax=Arthrobotrys musiformis TaxID=47236 RepID=A0AAV9WC04_9PEZI
MCGVLTTPLDNNAPQSPGSDLAHPPKSQTTKPQAGPNTSTAARELFVEEPTAAPELKAPLPYSYSTDNATDTKEQFQNTNNTSNDGKRAVDSEIFFKWTVVCPSHFRMIAMSREVSSYPEIKGRKRPDLLNLPSGRAHVKAKGIYTSCTRCICNDNGRIKRTPERLSYTKWAGNGCREAAVPTKCELWYSKCEATMYEPEADPGISVEEYQEALDNIPLDIKIANSGWTWKHSSDRSMSWRYTFNKDGDTRSTERYLVPGTKEPYYLEGPDRKSSWDQEGPGGPLFAFASKFQGAFDERLAGGVGFGQEISSPSLDPRDTGEDTRGIEAGAAQKL